MAITLVGKRDHVRQRDVIERIGRGARHAARHVGDTVMHDVVDDIGGVGVRGRPGSFTTPPLVYGNVDDDRARFHRLHHLGRHQFRRLRTRNQDAADHQVGLDHVALDRILGRKYRVGAATELLPVRLDRIGVAIDDPDVRTHANRDMRSVRANYPGPEDNDLGGINAGYATEQHTETAVRMFETVGSGLDSHAAGDLRHRRE